MKFTKLQLRRDTKENWELNNPILAEGELGIEFPNKIKIGDGLTNWNTLLYVSFDIDLNEVDPIYTKDKASLALKTEVEEMFEFSQKAIIEKDFETLSDLIFWTNNENNMLLVREGTIFRVLDDSSPDFKATLNPETGKFISTQIEPYNAEKIEYQTENVSNALDNRWTKDETRNAIFSASSSTYSSTIAYIDEQIKTFSEPLQLFINNDNISTEISTIEGTLVPLNLTTTEQLWFEREFIITSPGTIDKNIYDLILPFTLLSTSRITTCRAVWTISTNNDGLTKIIFDKEFILQNTTRDYDYEGKFIREYPSDISYSSGDIVKFSLYGRVSTGTYTSNVLLGDKDKQAVLIRTVPKATLSTTLNEINNKLGNLEDLSTSTKENVVFAINEISSIVNEVKIENAVEKTFLESDWILIEDKYQLIINKEENIFGTKGFIFSLEKKINNFYEKINNYTSNNVEGVITIISDLPFEGYILILPKKTIVSTSNNVEVGWVGLLPFSIDNVPFGYYPANGSYYLKDSLQGKVLLELPLNIKNTWGIVDIIGDNDTNIIDRFPPMTNYTTPSPYIVQASEFNSSYLPWKAFTKTNINQGSDKWISNGGSIGRNITLDFSVGTNNSSFGLIKYSIETRNDSVWYCPDIWTLQGGISPSFSINDWINIDSKSNQKIGWNPAVKKIFPINNKTRLSLFSKFRLLFTTTESTLSIGELTFYTAPLTEFKSICVPDYYKETGFLPEQNPNMHPYIYLGV